VSVFAAVIATLKRSSAIWMLAILLGCDSAAPWGGADTPAVRRERASIVENLASQLAVLIQKENRDAVQRTMNAMAERGGDLLSVGIRRNSGDLYARTPEHDRRWIPSEDSKSTVTHVLVPIYAAKDIWGNVEVSFRAPVLTTLPRRDLSKILLRNDDVPMAQSAREAVAAYLATQLAVLVQDQDKDAVQRTIDAIGARGGELLSVGIRRNSGELMGTANHDRSWIPLKDGKSTMTHVAVPFYVGRDVWGDLEVSFRR